MIDWFMEFKEAAYPDEPVTREQSDSVIDGFKDNGKAIFTSPGKQNFIGEALLVKVAISVIGGLIGKALIAGGRKAIDLLRAPPGEIAGELGYDEQDERREIVINVVQFIQQNKADIIIQRVEAHGPQVRPGGHDQQSGKS